MQVLTSIWNRFRKGVIPMGQRDKARGNTISKRLGGSVKRVGGRHLEVLYLVQLHPSGQAFLEVWGFRPLSLIVETEITSDDSSEPGVRMNDGGIIR